jgi:putative hydrolase of the HAD superfamily
MIKAIIFDLDNTLLDFMAFKHASVDAALDAMIQSGLRLGKDEAKKRLYAIYDKHGIEYDKIFDDFLADVEGAVDYRKLAHAIHAYRHERSQHLLPYPMVIPTLRKLRDSSVQLAIVSDAPRIKAWMRLVGAGLDPFFGIVVTHDDTCKFKPCPEPFEAALKLLRVTPSEVLMVGDNAERDIKGAKALGIKTCWAEYGAEKPLSVKPDFVIKEIDELLGIVKQT